MSRAEAAAAVRALAGLPPRERIPQSPTLPSAAPRMFTLNEDQLHDLTYHAVTTYLRGLSGMTDQRAHLHAGRIAAAAVLSALASDYRHG